MNPSGSPAKCSAPSIWAISSNAVRRRTLPAFTARNSIDRSSAVWRCFLLIEAILDRLSMSPMRSPPASKIPFLAPDRSSRPASTDLVLSGEPDMTMTPRERVLAAVNHEEPDRVPIVLGVSNATGIKMKPYRELKQLLDIDAPDDYLYRWPELGTAAPDEETLVRLGTDVRGVCDV